MESKALSHLYVGTQHLLLGLLGEREGLAAKLLHDAGIELGPFRDEIRQALTPVLSRDAKEPT
jgi:ATP-dependent Clp protease ATP-binding subunit ClpA